MTGRLRLELDIGIPRYAKEDVFWLTGEAGQGRAMVGSAGKRY